jgi:2-hydroxymuconate-semialdehyde hydrolase
VARIFTVLIVLLAGLVAVPPILSPLLGWGADDSTAPPPGRLIEIAGGRRVNVVDAGSGPPIVLVHGQPGSAYDWRPLPARLARTHRVIRYDRIGYGHSDRRAADEEFSIEANALELLAVLDALGIKTATLVGWSYGGGVVVQAALLEPRRIRRLVLIGSVGPAYRADEPGWLDRILSSKLARRWSLAAGFPARAAVWLESVEAFSSSEAMPEWWVEQALAMDSLPGAMDSYLGEERDLRLDGLRPEEIRVRVLIIHGENDRVVPTAVGEDLHRRFPRSSLLVVNDGSHMLPITHADLLATRIDAFTRGDAG